ncbi:MAG TPA: phosphoribosyltransferase family protein [Candidatus Saccharimonadales bacterium]|nr:phosphoribosyltransferase family protein [Candidatus Saccharimonadales bacterium]
MYFASRVQAGRMLAGQLVPKYRYENCSVVALNDGGVMVGAQIAAALHCSLSMLLSEEIVLPREPDAIAGIAQDGSFAYNDSYSSGEIDEFQSEYYHYIEQEKMTKLQELHRLLGDGGSIDKRLLKGHNVILVSDGMKTSFAMDVAVQFLKPIATEKLIIATPLASVKAVDRMHIVADDLCVLSVIDDYMDTPHYYDKDDVPEHEKVMEIINRIIMQWR